MDVAEKHLLEAQGGEFGGRTWEDERTILGGLIVHPCSPRWLFSFALKITDLLQKEIYKQEWKGGKKEGKEEGREAGEGKRRKRKEREK